ncbi:MAG: prepilin-type N-terminal cleavage/methylation domain-containing protein [Phycisphaerales bacterium]
MKPRPRRNRPALTLIEVLASLVLLAMLTAAAASLTGHAAKVASLRLDSTNTSAALDALTRLILADIELVQSAARSTSEQRETGSHETITTEPGSLILSVRQAGDTAASTRIVYTHDPTTSTISRTDGFAPNPTPRLLLGEVDRFDVSLNQPNPESSYTHAMLSITIRSRSGVEQTIRLPIPSARNSNG